MKQPLSTTALLSFTACLAPFFGASLAGCGDTPPPQTPPQPAEPAKPKVPAALKLPPRAVAASRGTAEFLGKLGSKSVYSVGGERWIVDEKGKTEREAEPLGERLFGVIPFAQGGVSALAWNSQHAFSFADPLGAPKIVVESTSPFTRVRPGPNAMLLFGMWAATAVDATSGLERQGFFPQLPVRDAIFLDGQRGAVAAAVGGIGITTDGGKTWRSLRHRASANPTLTFAVDGGEIFVREPYASRGARIDFGTGELVDWTPLGGEPPPGTTPIEGWITTLGNPIPSAVKNGIDAGGGTGIVARDGALARVDLATGLFTEVVVFEATKHECRGAMVGKEAYLLCGSYKGKREAGEQLWRVKTGPKLEIERVKDATFAGAGYVEIVGSASGGMMVAQGCGEKWGGLCVRQPSGSFAAVPVENVPYRSGAAPLADGRVVSAGVRATETGPLIELCASSEREKVVLQDVDFDDRMMVAVTRPEEGEDKVVRFLVTEKRTDKKEAFYYLYAFEPGKKGFRKTALPDVTQVSFADGVLLAYSKEGEKFRVSHDLGVSFKDLDMPKGAAVDFTAITRLGTISSTHTRVGWEPLPPAAPPPKVSADLKLHTVVPLAKSEMELACTTSGTEKKGQMLPKYDGDLTVAFGVPKAPKGTVRQTSAISFSHMDASLLLVAEGKAPKAPKAAEAEKWTVRWLDPREPDAKVRSLSTKAPFPTLSLLTRGAWAEGSKLFFTVEVGGRNTLVRSKGAGFETAHVHDGLFPSQGSPQAFSADGSVIAYLAGEVLVVWKSGEAPRPIGTVNQRAGTVLGAPSKEGVPVLVDVEGQSYYRVFPLPSDKLVGSPEYAWISGTWDGWTRGSSLFGGRGPIALCGAKPVGASFRGTSYAPEMWARFDIDGASAGGGSSIRYEVVSDGQAFCVQSLMMAPPGKAWVNRKAASVKKPMVGLDTLRFFAKGNKGEITSAGRADKTPLHAMTCDVAKKG